MEMIWYSRELAYVLRHGAKSAGLAIRGDGYVKVEELLNIRSLRGLSFGMLDTIVSNDPKQRFSLILGRNGRWIIRANERHSIPEVMGGLKRIRWAWQVPLVVHGTSMKAWETISKQGLSRMGRTYIHFAQDLTENTTSGVPSSCEVLIFIDLTRAVKEGNRFFLSSNGIIVTHGNEAGFLEPRFFSRVESNGAGPLIPKWEGPVEDEGKEIAAPERSSGVIDVGPSSVSKRVMSSILDNT
ncbi:KptA family-domain-containing protein [Mycena sanguinolenta]|nr:KptA family-domain-containing protein [Mycena sanguinolenta]